MKDFIERESEAKRRAIIYGTEEEIYYIKFNVKNHTKKIDEEYNTRSREQVEREKAM